jgi:hypothetical protein
MNEWNKKKTTEKSNVEETEYTWWKDKSYIQEDNKVLTRAQLKISDMVKNNITKILNNWLDFLTWNGLIHKILVAMVCLDRETMKFLIPPLLSALLPNSTENTGFSIRLTTESWR